MNRIESGYVEAMLWTSQDENDVNLDMNYSDEDISKALLSRISEDCRAFIEKASEALRNENPAFDLDTEQVGHDFWLTRNGHGAGFWDGDYERNIGEILTKIAQGFGNHNIYVEEDGKIYDM